MRKLIRNNRGEVIGEDWTLASSEVKTILAALDVHAGSDTLGAAPAKSLHELLNAREPDMNSTGFASAARTR